VVEVVVLQMMLQVVVVVEVVVLQRQHPFHAEEDNEHHSNHYHMAGLVFYGPGNTHDCYSLPWPILAHEDSRQPNCCHQSSRGTP
jgi:hypothetical protein